MVLKGRGMVPYVPKSGQEAADVYLELDKDVYVAGDKLTGHVHINAKNDWLCMNKGALKIAFTGQEEIKMTKKTQENLVWAPGPHNSTRKSVHKQGNMRGSRVVDVQKCEKNMTAPFYANQPIVYCEGILMNFKHDPIPEGHHTIPFAIDIPKGLPSSMCSADKKEYSQVEYLAKVTLESRFREITITDTKKFALLRDGISVGEEHPLWYTPQCQGLTTTSNGKVFERGTLKMVAALQRPVLDRGDTFKLRLGFSNNSTLALDKCTVTFTEHVTLNDPKKQNGKTMETSEKKLGSTTYHFSDADTYAQAVGAATRDANDVPGRGSKFEDTTYRDISEDMKNKNCAILTMKVPKTAHDSYKGNLVRVAHKMHIKLFTKSNSNNLTMETLDVHIAPRTGRELTPEGQKRPSLLWEDLSQRFPPGRPASMRKGHHWEPYVWECRDVSKPHLNGSTILLKGGKGSSGLEPCPYIAKPSGTPQLKKSTYNYNSQEHPSLAPKQILSKKFFFKQLAMSFDPASVIRAFHDNPKAYPAVSALKPGDLPQIMKAIHPKFRKSLCLDGLAKTMGTEGMTCAHVVAALRASKGAAERCDMVTRLAPYCGDLGTKRYQIAKHLSAYESSVCQDGLYGRTTTRPVGGKRWSHAAQNPEKTYDVFMSDGSRRSSRTPGSTASGRSSTLSGELEFVAPPRVSAKTARKSEQKSYAFSKTPVSPMWNSSRGFGAKGFHSLGRSMMSPNFTSGRVMMAH